MALRSLVLPGWGQAANGRWIKSALFAGAYTGFVAWGVALNQDKQDAVGRLHTALGTETESAARLDVERLKNDRNGRFWFAGLTLLLSMADAFVDANLRDFDERIEAEVAAEGDGVGMQVTVRLGGTGR